VIDIADKDGARGYLLLEMATQTQRLVARNQQARINAAMWVMACGATFAHRLMLKHEWPLLCRVALGAHFVRRHEFRSATFNHGVFVRIVAIDATYLAFENRMMRRQIELPLLVQMTLETGLRRFARVNDGVGAAA